MRFIWNASIIALIFLCELGLVHVALASDVSVRRLKEIRYVGVENPREFENALPFVPGDEWKEEFVRISDQLINDYQHKHGYFHSKIAVSRVSGALGDVILNIRVEQGEPCTIRSIHLDDPPGFKSKHVMMRFKSSMVNVLKLEPGQRFDGNQLSDRLRGLRDWLVSENYLFANTDSVELNFNSNKSEVDIKLDVKYGERITFGFHGNTIFSKGELVLMIEEARLAGFGKDYLGTIKRKVTSAYEQKAFNDVHIVAKESEHNDSRHFTFIIDEGIRTELEQVRWEGISGENIEEFQRDFDRGASRLIQRGYFVEKDLDRGVAVALEGLKARGYLSSRMVSRLVLDTKRTKRVRRVKVVVQVSEGEQALLGAVSLLGNTYLSEDVIFSILGLELDKPFNPFAFEEGLQKLRSRYLEDGYLDYMVVTPEPKIVEFLDGARQVNVLIQISEGKRFKVGRVIVNGLQLTKSYVVNNQINLKTDEWCRAAAIEETESNLRKLGIFSNVRVSLAASTAGDDVRDVIIDLQEADPGVLEVGPGFRSDLGVRSFMHLSYNNIFGRGWIGAFGAESNRRLNEEYRFLEYKFDTSFTEPRLFGSETAYSFGVSTRKQRFPPDFNAVTTQFVTSVERQIFKIASVKLAYRFERIRQFDVYFQGRLSDRDNRSMLIGSIIPSFVIDTRDSPFTTSSGWLLNGSLEYAHPYFSNQSLEDQTAPAYQKWTGSLHRYFSLPKGITWSNVISGGFARSNLEGREIPLIKLFRLGGYGTLRGFAEDSLNVDATRIEGTLTFLSLRSQFDLPLVGDLKFAPFIDAGNLYIDTLRGQPFFRTGAGVGLHYLTPVGPINLDWGYKLNPLEGDTPYQIHFSVGVI